MKKLDYTIFYDNCPLSHSVLECLLDDINALIDTLVTIVCEPDKVDSDAFYDPFSRAMDAWVREEADKERILKADDVTKMREEMHEVAKYVFEEIIRKNWWFCWTYRFKLANTYETGLIKRTIIQLSSDKQLIELPKDVDIDDLTNQMIKYAEKVIRMIF